LKVAATTIFDILSPLRAYFQLDVNRTPGDEEPFRAALFSLHQLNRHGKAIAQKHRLRTDHCSDQLLKRLHKNEAVLLEVRNLLVETVRDGKAITPGGEWLLDNFYLIEEQVVIARKHLPKGYSEALPCLEGGPSSGMPRVYDIVLEIIAHSDGRVDIKSLSSFIASYQSVTALTLGELWAIPIMLRLAVIENLRRVCGKIALDMVDNNLADYWADRMMATVKDDPGNLILTIADMARSKPVLGSPFVAAFTRRLQGKGPALALPLSWMEQKLSGMLTSGNELVLEENQKQATDQVSVSNSIGTLRFLGATDWREFVETLSSVEQVLRQDTTGTYPQMDFATRDRYRHVVESIARASPLTETEVAQKALDLSMSETHAGTDKQSHIGYFLIDEGLTRAEHAASMKYSARQKFTRLAKKLPVTIYLLSIIVFTLLVSAGMFSVVYTYSNIDIVTLGILGIACLFGAAQLVISLVNWLATIWVTPQLLPRMDFSQGIPSEFRTLVIVPTMLAGKDYIEELTEALEIRFLANKEDNVHFGLLTDFPDANSETLAGDDELLQLAKNRIAALNKQYKTGEQDIFFLFHRSRTWNRREKKWMGYERKRGKLSALNAFIRGKGDGQLSCIEGDHSILSDIKYIITLDSDTQLPREAVWKFVATMAHPLNRPLFDPVKKRIVSGYGILQPRVGSGIPKNSPSLFLRLQGDLTGIDPYTRVSSDVYQDLFGEGSFIGKGIYDVDAFEQSLHDVFPENRILSHDLLEGCYVRSGLLSDVLLYEDNPSKYEADADRHHRWIRGDWQIGAWMLPFVTGKNKRLSKNKLSALSRWKIFDNLRRSLLPLSLMVLLLMSWFLLPFAGFWTAAVTIILLLPVTAAQGWQLLNKPVDLTYTAHITEIGIAVRNTLLQFIFGIAVLPYQAARYTDAVLRTNWRMIVSRRHLLEWTTSANAAKKAPDSVWASYRSMWIAPFVAVFCFIFLFQQEQVLRIAMPILTLWFIAPFLAWRLSIPEAEQDNVLPEEQSLFLHQSARKTWAFFEEFVTAEDNWLPPDNYQEQPIAVIAHRTSPTNIGLSLLANLAAYDFGYIPGGDLLRRSHNTLQTLLKLERYKGHFYNWYDTISLVPLNPRYVSTVDSGNLVGHLLTLRQGVAELSNAPVFRGQQFAGLETTTNLILASSKGRSTEIAKKIMAILSTARYEGMNLAALQKKMTELERLVAELSGTQMNRTTDESKWIERLCRQTDALREETNTLVPWLPLLPVPAPFARLQILEDIPTLVSVQELEKLCIRHIDEYQSVPQSAAHQQWLEQLRKTVTEAATHAIEQAVLIEAIAELCEQFSEIEYDFLFERSTGLLRIGYNVDEQRKDDSYYDLLASEARLGIFVGIAQGKLPQESWFALGRLLTNSGGDPILLSWSGSMFEYLMPQLVMPSFENTLLHQTSKATVKRQIEYASQRSIPWGISESAYNNVDANLNYQYRAFGVPGLGLKRGLEEDLVIAPYASMLALMVMPAKACANLQLLAREGFEGEYGFYEAIDYTAARLPRGKTHTLIPSYMVHHQGMGLLSLAYVLLNKPMQRRFEAELRFRATILLLQERIPRATVFYAHTADIIETHTEAADVQIRKIATPHTVLPEIQLLSNSRYQVMITNSGGGYSRWKDIAITRWREDSTKDDRGIFCYIKDVASGQFWSNTYQPTLAPAKNFEAVFSQGHAELRRQDFGIDTKTDIVISPEDDTEMRRIKIINRTLTVRILEITSYAEIVMAPQASDESHPAFSNLFVQTEIIPEYKTIFCSRRPRSADEQPPWMFHHVDVQGASVEAVSYETDRMKFIGRGKSLVAPAAMNDDGLSGTQGAVLDPIVAIRHRIVLKPYQTATIDLIIGVSDTREACEVLMHKYRDQPLKKRAFELSWTHSQVLLRQINATEADAQLYNRLAASVIYANPALRAAPAVILNNYRGQSGLWSHSVSGDLPIVLLHIHDPESLDLVRRMIQVHAYWRLKGLAVDLVIWNEDHGTYRQVLQEQILGLISSQPPNNPSWNKPGNIYVRSADQVSAEDRTLFESVARIILHDNKGTLVEQLDRINAAKALPALLDPVLTIEPQSYPALAIPKDLLFFNGIGGFTQDGKEYKIILDSRQTTPAPWVNVIANPEFGTVISETGSAYTWAVNAHEYRITPWSNDPVSDIGGEAFYLRDEETGYCWSPSSFPAPGNGQYLVTHGFGYSTFEHHEDGIASEMVVFVDKDLPVKFVVLKITNHSGRDRLLSATGYLEIILGDVRAKTNMHVLSQHDAGTGALLLRNRYNTAFAERVAFFRLLGTEVSFTTDRVEFIGRNRNLAHAEALGRKNLSGRSGAGMDPCAALQGKFDLADGEEREIIFQFGSAVHATAAIALLQKFAEQEAVSASLNDVKEYWRDALGAIQVTTPDPALNILANGWLAYQTLACRIFARSGFYQSGGAFGFRDQLQDVLALLHTKPAIARNQILLNASRQFEEGDVQHWWHPPEGRGVRTRCSDDLLWLPFAVSRYIDATGDVNILKTPVAFLESRPLHDWEESHYDLHATSRTKTELYDHCVRAIRHGLRFGKHGLPLIGAGDWNDGMDMVGHKGLGESVWLAFFLYEVLTRFAGTAEAHNDADFATLCRKEAATLQGNIETYGWDGQWYMRAYFDDGTPLGSRENDECSIDAIAQSWSVLSGAGNRQRVVTAMASLDKYLVRRDIGLIQLLDPAFDKPGLNPGYIKGYVPGVRENGGQYSHAAIWALMAFAELGDREKVWELFSMVQPISHSSDTISREIYKAEPYVMAADVYANESHKGRGGWTWYTGSSGWMYQFIISSLLGLERRSDLLTFRPCFPQHWPSVSIAYRYGTALYHLTVFQVMDMTTALDDKGTAEKADTIRLIDDGQVHHIAVRVPVATRQLLKNDYQPIQST
jgi:cellobiose phosphorylase